MKVNMGEFEEGVVGNAVTIALAPLAEPIMKKLFLSKYGENAPDDIVAFWSIIFGSALYGTITQANTNGIAGVYANFLSMLPYGASFILVDAIAKRVLKDKYRPLTNPEKKTKVVGQLSKKEAKRKRAAFTEEMKKARRKSSQKITRFEFIDKGKQRLIIRSLFTAVGGFALNRYLERRFLIDARKSNGDLQVTNNFQGLHKARPIPMGFAPRTVHLGPHSNPYLRR